MWGFLLFSTEVFVMDAERNDSSSQGSDNSRPARGTICSSPYLRAQNKEKSNEKMKLKIRRKVLKLSTPAPPNTGSQDNDEGDSNYAPASDDEVGDAAEGSNRKGLQN